MKTKYQNKLMILSLLGFVVMGTSVDSYNFRRKSMMREPVAQQHQNQKSHEASRNERSFNPYDLGGSFQSQNDQEQMPSAAHPNSPMGHQGVLENPQSRGPRWEDGYEEERPATPFAVSEQETTRNMVRNSLRLLREKPLEEGNEFASFMTEGAVPNSNPMLQPPIQRPSESNPILRGNEGLIKFSNSDLETRPYRGQFYSRSSRPFVLDPGLVQRWKSRAVKKLPKH